MLHGCHPSFTSQFAFPNARKVLLYESSEQDTTPLLKSILTDLGTSFSHLEWLAWLNFYYDDSKWKPAEKEELHTVLGLRFAKGFNHFVVKRGADYNYYGGMVDDIKNCPQIQGTIDEKLEFFL